MSSLITPIKSYFKHQIEMLELPDLTVEQDICLSVGGLGSGKTLAAVHYGLIMSQQFPGAIGLVGHKFLQTLKGTVIADYLATLTQWGLNIKEHYSYNKADSTLILHCWGDSIIYFKGLENPEEALRSFNADWAHIEEVNLAGENAYLKVIERIRRPGRNKIKRIVLTMNPTMRNDWLRDLFLVRAGKFTENGVSIMRRRVVSKTQDNTALSGAYALNLKETLSPLQYQALVLGEDVMLDSGLVIANWSSVNEDETLFYDEERVVYIGCDFNVDPMSWVLCHIAVDHRGKRHFEFFEELCYGPTTTPLAADRLAERLQHHKAGIKIIADFSGFSRSTNANTLDSVDIVHMLKAFNDWGVRLTNKDVLKKTVNPRVSDSYQTFIDLVKTAAGESFITANPKNCPWFVWNMKNLEWITGGDGFEIREPTRNQIEKDASGKLKYTKHIFDAARYITSYFEGNKKDERLTHKAVYRDVPFIAANNRAC